MTYTFKFYSKEGDRKQISISARSVYEANNKFRNGHNGCRVIEIRIRRDDGQE